MVTSRQIKEKVRDYRRSIKHSWSLFRESRIGMVGLAIMVFFIVMALTSPFLGLRHPLDWWAPDSDILSITEYFGEDGVRTPGPLMNTIVPRNMDGGRVHQADRFYTAAGYADDPFQRYGLYAFNPNNGARIWSFEDANSEITSNIAVHSHRSVFSNHAFVFFGCENGLLFALKDDQISFSRPEWPNTRSSSLGGAVKGLSTFTADTNRLVIASTSNGYLYAFDFSVVGTLTEDRSWNPIWVTQISNVSLNVPITSPRLGYVFVGSVDGRLYALNVHNGAMVEDWPDGGYEVHETKWHGSPAIHESQTSDIFATTHDGVIHCIYAENGTAKEGWAHIEQVGNQFVSKDGYQLRNLGEIDGGNLTEVTATRGSLLVGSDTGFVYSINRASITEDFVFNTRIGLQDTEVRVRPAIIRDLSEHIYISARHLNETPADPSDDFTIVYCLNGTGDPAIKWRMILDGVVMVPPMQSGIDINHNIFFATVFFDSDGTPRAGRLYSFDAAGTVISPLPPTWLTKEGHEDPKYRPPPSGNKYWLGTDTQGHDILSQTVLGSRIALLVGFLSAFFSISIGVIFGLVSGYYGKGVDAVLMRFTDVILVLPALPLLITFAAIMNPSIWNIILIISLVGWGGVARVIRAEVLSLKERPFIDSARVTGASKSRIMFKHIAPNVLPLGLLYMTFAISGAILFEAALSFIGLGDPSTMTWGMMLNYVQHSNALTNWWWLLPPGICITLVCLAFFLLGRAFDEVVNPRLRRRR